MIKKCLICGAEYVAQRSTAKYCSERCRVRAHRGGVLTGRQMPPDVRASMTDEEVAAVIEQAHGTASDLSRASMLTPAPLCRSLKTVSRKLHDALEAEGL